jgi:hypothetical protein
MPDLHDAGVSDGRAAPGTEAGGVSRRSVLRGAAGAGAAGIAVTALAGAGLTATASASASATAPATGRQRAASGASAEPVVVYVRDAAAGEIDVFRGTACTRLHDRALAAELVRASK